MVTAMPTAFKQHLFFAGYRKTSHDFASAFKKKQTNEHIFGP
jgi:hypothetical protein